MVHLPEGRTFSRLFLQFCKKTVLAAFVFLTFFGIVLPHLFHPVYADVTSTPSPTTAPGNTSAATWAFDAEVTEVGKNADRARQLLWWVFTHPGVHSAGVLAQVWAISRNIVYVFIVLVIVAFGLAIILSRRFSVSPIFSGISSPFSTTNLPTLFYKIGAILLFVTFSYVLIVGIIQLSEVSMRFFIENVGGKDLFNVVFSGAGNSEANYTSFIGYRDINPLNQEMVHTSLFIVRITSFTYYVMSLILILRTVLLWFLLIVSPFLALLMPFVFIRNTGWIWIGVFFQWVFYGPLMALFLATLTRVWVSGIPYSFDFTRANCTGPGAPDATCTGNGQIYKTAINILYGGPAQTLAPGNSGNYIDTYAEYVIALVMLWAAVILPWLLLRIFRDYCCGTIAASNATLTSIFDRLRQFPTPSPSLPFGPSTATGIAVELPFRQRVEEKIREVTHTNIENITEVNRTNTTEIAKSLNASVSSLSDVSRFELNQTNRSQVTQNLQKLSSPERISSSAERQQFVTMRNTLETRAATGDRVAQALLSANSTEKSKEILTSLSSKSAVSTVDIAMVGGRSQFSSPQQGGYAPSKPQGVATATTGGVSVYAQKVSITTLSQKTGMSEEKIDEVIRTLETIKTDSTEFIQTIAQKTDLSKEKITALLQALTSSVNANPGIISIVSKNAGVSENNVKDVLTVLSTIAEPNAQILGVISEKTKLTESQVKDVLSTVSSSVLVETSMVSDIAKKSALSEKKITEVITLLPQMTNLSTSIESIAKKVGITPEQVEQVARFVKATGGFAKQAGKENKVVSMGGKDVSTQVSLEDYEEVKNMWLKHYREAPVPFSTTISTREEWLTSDIKKLTNVSHLVGSNNPQLKQKGLDEIAEILPFLLLGGFSDIETYAYVKAKLEAAKQINEEAILEQKAKDEAKSEVKEEEDTLLTVDEKKRKQEKAAKAAGTMTFDEEKKK